MSHHAAFEALDRLLQDIHGNKSVMGGVTVVLGGDFRQTLPVVPRGTKADELSASLKASPLWKKVRKLKLTINMRVHLFGDNSAEEFAKKLLSIGNGQLFWNGELKMHQVPCGEFVPNIDALIEKGSQGLQIITNVIRGFVKEQYWHNGMIW